MTGVAAPALARGSLRRSSARRAGDPDYVDGGASYGRVSQFGNHTTFTGRDWDAQTGLMYYRYRMYEPMAGRFVSRDPVGYMDSLNLEAAVLNRVVSAKDPVGLYFTSDQVAWQSCVGNPSGLLECLEAAIGIARALNLIRKMAASSNAEAIAALASMAQTVAVATLPGAIDWPAQPQAEAPRAPDVPQEISRGEIVAKHLAEVIAAEKAAEAAEEAAKTKRRKGCERWYRYCRYYNCGIGIGFSTMAWITDHCDMPATFAVQALALPPDNNASCVKKWRCCFKLYMNKVPPTWWTGGKGAPLVSHTSPPAGVPSVARTGGGNELQVPEWLMSSRCVQVSDGPNTR